MSRELPVLFNTEMVTAILDDRKTATRRIIKPRFRDDESGFQVLINTKDPDDWQVEKVDKNEMSFYNQRYIYPPYQPGDILYVRETWGEWTDGYLYKAWNSQFPQAGYFLGTKWHPSIHMPKEAARIWLKVTDVKPERLQNMTLDDFLNEGISIPYEAFNDSDNTYMKAKRLFTDVWNSTVNKKERDLYEWNANPWVWVIEFERVQNPEARK